MGTSAEVSRDYVPPWAGGVTNPSWVSPPKAWLVTLEHEHAMSEALC
jgi:hypothetical protein